MEKNKYLEKIAKDELGKKIGELSSKSLDLKIKTPAVVSIAQRIGAAYGDSLNKKPVRR